MQKLFEKNIRFFYENLPHYYNLIASIKSRNFKIQNNNIFLHNKPIYKNDIYTDSKIIASNPINNPLWKRHFFIKPKKWNEKEFYITGEIINSFLSSNDKYYFDNDFLPTTMIFGLLSGKHLDLIREKYNLQSIFIYEPNPEFFAISLYFVDYAKLYQKYNDRLFLWIGGEIDYFAIEKFFYERIITSSFLNIYYKAYNHPLLDDAINKFKIIQASKLRGWGTFEDEIKGVKNHLNNLNKYPLLESFEKTNAPFCIVANGKSLEKNIEFIKNNKESMIIISVGTAIKPLMKAKIESDFHFEQERIDILIEALKDILPNYNGYFIGASVVNNEVFKMAKNPLMYIREAFSLEKDYTPLIGSSPIVGNAGFAFASFFAKEIYLCGMDLGFRLGDKKHSKNSFYDERDDIAQNGIKIEGNFSNDIYTDSLLLSSKQKIEKMIEMFNLKVYNLSDGAFIKGSIPLNDKTLPKINKEKIIKKILKNFKKTTYTPPKLNLTPLLNALKKAFNLSTKNQIELTGKIDFIEDLLKEYSKIDPNNFNLIKGSIFHIAINYYAEYFKGNDKKEEIIKRLDKFNEFLKTL
ncbi:6-hydroxymethylpterin diphosphokinase MptE-like protein [Caminibacter mediatlanticus]|uniref:Motility associated factor glycosyltransferase family protein n=1 Tax=Caminibacter mediatlanticus TB-2 TaxID=391592 RepID=A0AAI9F1S4_9BACT|nr:6-hydroxymethylpterin diphosphokinase MptE-like protein [Caminibacter mediatlanticus]EDM23015.1 hypothetical protein CMTB2_08555 [Caminibacter mediatlanticus TB-2]